MDRRETPIRNVGQTQAETLSQKLLGTESGFAAPADFAYEGRFSPVSAKSPGTLTEGETRAIAAKAAGVEERELREERTAEGPDARRCYSAGGLLIGVSARGLDYLAQTRLIGSPTLEPEAAREIAETFLEANGFEGLVLDSAGDNGALAVLRYAPEQEGALRVDDSVTVSVALDDGSIYAFDGSRYDPEPAEVRWQTDRETALAALPQNAALVSDRKVIRKSPGGTRRAAYEFVCTGTEGETLRIYVDAETGRQTGVEFG